jgi:ABC-type nitrate/sulfonate/bicarbonate transport system permease component
LGSIILLEKEPSISAMNQKSPRRRSEFNATWLAVGIVLGTAVGVSMDNLTIGVGIGVAVGVILAFVIPKKDS